ncbi:MAG TPA: hypothetical protein VMS96_03135 [Terriglobales bacterium]|nr:hypothetical protein [Terriglobales bacterium]
MRSLCILLSAFVLLCPLLLAQSAAPQPAPPKSEAQVSFDALKTLAGEWEGPVTIDPPLNGVSMADLRVAMRVTSKGHAIVHELQEQGAPFWMRSEDQAAKIDHPVTMLYLNDDQLNLVHYCDAGNRPHMIGKASPDGKTIDFQFVDISGSPKRGHMHGSSFTLIDANHHKEEWTFILPGDQVIHARFDLRRVN